MIRFWIIRLGILVAGLSFVMVPLSAHAQGGTDVTETKVKAALPLLDKYIQDAMTKTGVPGLSVAVVFDDKVVYLKGYGVREVGKPDVVTEDTVFQLASMSKSVGSTVVAALVSDKVVTWDTRVSQIDPSFQLKEPYPTSQVTIRDLYSHRSGLDGNAGNDLEQIGYDRDTILSRLRFLNPASSFRSTYAYSNFGITAGGVAAATAAGKSWEDASQDKLYGPLGMTSTSSRYADFLKRTNRATLHAFINGKWTAAATREPDAQSPAGGVSSNAKDLAEWMRLELGNGKYNGKQLISEDAIGATHLPVIYRGNDPALGVPSFYGLGWTVEYDKQGRLLTGHAGAFSQGARTLVTLSPSEKLGIVVLANAFPTGLPEAVSAAFFDYVREGKSEQDWLQLWDDIYVRGYGPESYAPLVARYAKPPASPSAALPNSAYIGTYANDYIGNAYVIEKDGGLALQLGPNKITFPLKHYDRDLFVYYPYPEMPTYPASATFTVGADQKAASVLFDDLNSIGQGTLTRVQEK